MKDLDQEEKGCIVLTLLALDTLFLAGSLGCFVGGAHGWGAFLGVLALGGCAITYITIAGWRKLKRDAQKSDTPRV